VIRRVLSSESAYLTASARQRSGANRDLDIVDEKDRNLERSLTSLFGKHHRDPEAFKRNVPTRKIRGRLQLAPPGERSLYRGTITMLADVDGRPTVVEVTPSNDAQWRAIQRHDKAVFAAVTKGDDSGLSASRSRIVVDAETGRRYRFHVDGDGIRDATDVGEVELQELFYSGHRSHDLDALHEEDAS
jgi:hypothetical protein